jgi:hypothetical protein
MRVRELTPQDEADRRRLLAWMEANKYDITLLAEATGDFYANVSDMTKGVRRISQGFKFRFGEHFGDAERNKLFRHVDTSVPTPVTEPV